MTVETMRTAILEALRMALDAEDDTDWFTGLHPTLAGLSAQTLSAQPHSDSPSAGRSSIAAHLRHIAYSLGATNAWLAGENPVLDWQAAWRQVHITEDGVQALLGEIAAQRRTLEARLENLDGLGARSLTTALKSIVHLGYHVGAIRQIRLGVQ